MNGWKLENWLLNWLLNCWMNYRMNELELNYGWVGVELAVELGLSLVKIILDGTYWYLYNRNAILFGRLLC